MGDPAGSWTELGRSSMAEPDCRSLLVGLISKSYGFAVHGGSKAGSREGGFGESDEVEPAQVAVEILGCNAAKIAQKALHLTMPAVAGLDVVGIAHPFASC